MIIHASKRGSFCRRPKCPTELRGTLGVNHSYSPYNSILTLKNIYVTYLSQGISKLALSNQNGILFKVT